MASVTSRPCLCTWRLHLANPSLVPAALHRLEFCRMVDGRGEASVPLVPTQILVLFSSKIFCKIDTVAFSFVFDKYYPIID
jgi:hypothetical protein